MRNFENNVIDLGATMPRRHKIAAHPNTQTMRTQMNWMTRALVDRIGELVDELRGAAASGEATDPAGAERVAGQLAVTGTEMRERLDDLSTQCIPFPLERIGASKRRAR